MAISVNNIHFSYGSRKALNDVSFTLQTGGFHALLGPNGAGKSTLFALLTRLYQLQEGEISIDGKSIKIKPAELMQQLGVVFQQSTLDLDLTVKQNLLYHAALHGISNKAAMPRIETELSRMEMAERMHEKVRGLNGGHRRRVEIARALLHKPNILLLDEPTVGLDPQTRRSLNQHVRRLCEEDNLTVLWATHLMEEVIPEDPVILIHKGKVLVDDKAESLLQMAATDNLTEAFHILTESDKQEGVK